MKPIRRERIAAFLRNELAQILQRELHDPRLGFVSILSVSPTEDLKEAEVRVCRETNLWPESEGCSC